MGNLLKPEEGWLSFLLLFVMLFSVVGAVLAAGWVDGMGILPWIATVSLLWGYVFSRVRLPGAILHASSTVVGAGAVLYFVSQAMPEGTLVDRLAEIAERFNEWLSVVAAGGIATDNLLFLLLVAGVTWIIGYLGAWTVFYSHTGWWISLAAGAALILNLSYAPQLTAYFFVFLLCAITLVARLNVYSQLKTWREAGVTFGGELGWQLVRIGFVATLILVSVAWVAPGTLFAGQQMSEAWLGLSRPWDDVQSEFNRLFGGLRPRSQYAFSGFGKTLALRSGVRLGGEVVLRVAGDEPRRLKGVVYEKYTGQGWLASERSTYRIYPNEEHRLVADYGVRRDVTQTITVVQPRGTVVFAAAQPKRISIPTTAEMELPATVRIDLGESADFEAVPEDFRSAVELLADRAAQGRIPVQSGDNVVTVAPSVVARLSSALSPDLELVGLAVRGRSLASVELRPVDPDYADVTAIRSSGMLRRGLTYTAISSVSEADIASLRQAGTQYPQWVLDRYLSLPRTITPRTAQLARQLTGGYSNPYDRMAAIEAHLRGLAYNDVVKMPTGVRDAVDFFVFDIKEGYCDYFASAMAVMGRIIGVPTRVVSGYAPGEPDPSSNSVIVRDWAAHSWPEVYFPDYGWIEFEPTPARPMVWRPESPDQRQEMDASATLDDGFGSTPGLEDLPPDEFDSENGLAAGDLVFGPGGSLVIGLLRALGLVGSVVFIGYLALVSIWRRGLSGLAVEEAVYAKMCKLAGWLGFRRRRNDTPYEYARTLAAMLPGEQHSIQAITSAFVRRRFGRKNLASGEEDNLHWAWRQLRAAMLRLRVGR
ncbi:MAG: transglutaminase domain-containing protein [Chloroflexi bacterium]|nr:transglutaminase domain-containing protein [Chloroflexota bacterium]